MAGSLPIKIAVLAMGGEGGGVLADWIVDRLQRTMAEPDLRALATALAMPAPLDLRVNELRADRASVLQRLAAARIKAVPAPFAPLGIRVEGKPAINRLPEFLDGSVEVQDEGSQLVCTLVGAARAGLQTGTERSRCDGRRLAVLGKRVVFGIDVNLIAAIALPFIPKMARIARSSTLSIVAMPFIDAARAAGYSSKRIVLRHILPNIIAPYLIMVTAFIAQAILLEASLSFLGLGVTEPTPAWGLMLSGTSADFYKTAPWMILFPGLAITLAVFAFNLFGDSLRDWLDPKLKG